MEVGAVIRRHRLQSVNLRQRSADFIFVTRLRRSLKSMLKLIRNN